MKSFKVQRHDNQEEVEVSYYFKPVATPCFDKPQATDPVACFYCEATNLVFADSFLEGDRQNFRLVMKDGSVVYATHHGTLVLDKPPT